MREDATGRLLRRRWGGGFLSPWARMSRDGGGEAAAKRGKAVWGICRESSQRCPREREREPTGERQPCWPGRHAHGGGVCEVGFKLEALMRVKAESPHERRWWLWGRREADTLESLDVSEPGLGHGLDVARRG